VAVISSSKVMRARRYDTGEPVQVTVNGARIVAVEPARPAKTLAVWPFIAPGLFDLQINGYGGVWFSDRLLTPEKVVQAIEPYFAHGVAPRRCWRDLPPFARLANGIVGSTMSWPAAISKGRFYRAKTARGAPIPRRTSARPTGTSSAICRRPREGASGW
jgi:hypothetical protein